MAKRALGTAQLNLDIDEDLLLAMDDRVAAHGIKSRRAYIEALIRGDIGRVSGLGEPLSLAYANSSLAIQRLLTAKAWSKEPDVQAKIAGAIDLLGDFMRIISTEITKTKTERLRISGGSDDWTG